MHDIPDLTFGNAAVIRNIRGGRDIGNISPVGADDIIGVRSLRYSY
jgi:hypothetical protein